MAGDEIWYVGRLSAIGALALFDHAGTLSISRRDQKANVPARTAAL